MWEREQNYPQEDIVKIERQRERTPRKDRKRSIKRNIRIHGKRQEIQKGL